MGGAKFFKLAILFGFVVLVLLVVIVGYISTQQSTETRSRAAGIIPTPTTFLKGTPIPITPLQGTPIPITPLPGNFSWFIEFNCSGQPESYVLTSSAGCKDQSVWIKEASVFCNAKGGLLLTKYNLGMCQTPPPPTPAVTGVITGIITPPVVTAFVTPTVAITPIAITLTPTPKPVSYFYIGYICDNGGSYSLGQYGVCRSAQDLYSAAFSDCRTKLGGRCGSLSCVVNYAYRNPC